MENKEQHIGLCREVGWDSSVIVQQFISSHSAHLTHLDTSYFLHQPELDGADATIVLLGSTVRV
jgi:non-homologous end joining protein Ku